MLASPPACAAAAAVYRTSTSISETPDEAADTAGSTSENAAPPASGDGGGGGGGSANSGSSGRTPSIQGTVASISSMEYVPPPMADTRNAPSAVEADPDTATTRSLLSECTTRTTLPG